MGAVADLGAHTTRVPPPGKGTTGPRWIVPALLVAGTAALVVCLVLGGSVTRPVPSGLPDAGTGTRWALPVASFIAEVAAVLAAGAALTAVALIPRSNDHEVTRRRCRAHAGGLGALAAAADVIVFLLTLSELTGRPLPEALTASTALALAGFGPGRLLLFSSALSVMGAVVASRMTRKSLRSMTSGVRTGEIVLTISMTGALVPWALGGHAAQDGSDIAAPALVVHVLAAAAWVGGLTIMVLQLRGRLLIEVLPRFSRLALWCWLAIGATGVVAGWLRLSQVSDLWTTDYGRLLAAKLVALGILGGFGLWHRRRLTAGAAALRVRERAALIRVATVEVLVMGATMGIATALSATAPPAVHAGGHETAHGTGRIEAMLGHRLPVISVENLAALWRPDAVVTLLTAALLCWYVVGVRRLRGRGMPWPAGRTCWAIAAAVATVVTFDSGIATYASAVWSVTVTQQAVTSMVIPFAIVMSRPWSLQRDEFGTGPLAVRTGRLIARPWLIMPVATSWTALVLLTPVALLSVSMHIGLMAVRLGDIVVGTALFASLLRSPGSVGGRPGPRSWQSTPLFVWFAGQVAVTSVLLAGGLLPVRSWFTELNLAWITVADDERAAGVLHLTFAIGALFAIAAMPAGIGAHGSSRRANVPRPIGSTVAHESPVVQ